jgi:5-methylthioribose kinase
MSLESLRYERGTLDVLDQLLVPHEKKFVPVANVQAAWDVIRSMQVRGAPLIAIVAALGLAVEAHTRRADFGSVAAAAEFLTVSMAHLRTSRPTAVNLFRATDQLLALVASEQKTAASADALIDAYIAAAEQILEDDVKTNKAIGEHGAKRILEVTKREKVRVLTICNTGSLATAGYGTALGVVRSLHALGALEHVYACETRPYNQGARLTAFEIVEDKLPGTLIGDSMASYLMAVKGVDCVVVGADRVAANGDTANKIGTYQLAIAAKYHGVPFFAAVPTTTLDLTMSSGASIHVEERPADELTTIFGQRIAPEGIAAWNPSFDVTPSSLIRGVITEVGVAEAASDAGSDGIIDMAAFLQTRGLASLCNNAVMPSAAPTNYRRMDEASIAAYVLSMPKLAALVGVGELAVNEVGDGNLNFVYIVKGERGSIVVKQALPYVRCVGESWPLTLQRATFEANALMEERRLCPEFVPEVYHFDASKAMIVMRFVEPPNIILRKALMAGHRYSTFARDLATFLARTLFGTSSLAMDGGSLRLKVAEWSQNSAMCALTEKVIFTDPYTVCSMNHWTSPQLDGFAEAIRSSVSLKIAAAFFKGKFLSSTQALLHGDLHSGSVMASEGVTWVIDPEFAFYGPMGFDVGALLSNLFLSFFSQEATNGAAYAAWLLEQVIVLHDEFERQFLALWNAQATDGELFRREAFNCPSSLAQAQQEFLRALWWDSIGFAGMKMIRRVVGIAHVADLEAITDADKRSACEKRALALGAELVLAGHRQTGPLVNIRAVAERAKAIYEASAPVSLF